VNHHAAPRHLLKVNFFINPAVFTGYTGPWYRGNSGVVAFIVQEAPPTTAIPVLTKVVTTQTTPVPGQGESPVTLIVSPVIDFIRRFFGLKLVSSLVSLRDV
jgi:hypothetical protein